MIGYWHHHVVRLSVCPSAIRSDKRYIIQATAKVSERTNKNLAAGNTLVGYNCWESAVRNNMHCGFWGRCTGLQVVPACSQQPSSYFVLSDTFAVGCIVYPIVFLHAVWSATGIILSFVCLSVRNVL